MKTTIVKDKYREEGYEKDDIERCMENVSKSFGIEVLELNEILFNSFDSDIKKEEIAGFTLNKQNLKSFVLRGKFTTTMRKQLKERGGYSNSRLKGGSGWIFPNERYNQIKLYLQKLEKGKIKETGKVKFEYIPKVGDIFVNNSTPIRVFRIYGFTKDKDLKLEVIVLTKKEGIQEWLQKKPSKNPIKKFGKPIIVKRQNLKGDHFNISETFFHRTRGEFTSPRFTRY